MRWIEANPGRSDLSLHPPATATELAGLEQQLGGPLPADLRFLLTRFNGGSFPTGKLLPAGIEPGTIGAMVRQHAEKVSADFLDPELLLPFFRTEEESLLCFDRSGGPVADTWPIVDYDEESGEERLVYRTFDRFCRNLVADWTSPDFDREFTLDTYLRKGQRHASIEPDVASAHATVAHASKRAGLAELALQSYLSAARCIPALEWCDWEALKIAAILDDEGAAFEAASRLCARGPGARWKKRETSPGRVAEVMGPVAARVEDNGNWIRLFEQLSSQAQDDDGAIVDALQAAVAVGAPMPPLRPAREQSVLPAEASLEGWWEAAKEAYHAGRLREEDMLFDPDLEALRDAKPFAELLRIRRDF